MRTFALLALLLLTAGTLLAEDTPWSRPGAQPAPRWPAASELTGLAARGHAVFRAQACRSCHGPAARARATDLLRPPALRSEGWLLAHLFDPRSVAPDSPMPASAHLFEPVSFAREAEVAGLIELFDTDGNGRVSFVKDATGAWAADGARVARMGAVDIAGLRAPPSSALQTRSGRELWVGADGRRAYVDRWVPGEEQGDRVLSLRDARPQPRAEAEALVAFVQRLGRTARARADAAAWPRAPWVVARNAPSPGDAQRGRPIFERLCATCHGSDGRGSGPAARFLDVPPTDLVHGPFKYRSTALGERHSLYDLEDILLAGLPGSGMPGTGGRLSSRGHMDLLAFVVGLAPEGAPAPRSAARSAVPAMRLAAEDEWDGYMQHVLRGKAVFVALECSRCHGTEGRGDGPDAIVEWSDGRLVRARDFQPRDEHDRPRLRLRGGAGPVALWRRLMLGLDTKGMPGVHAAFREAPGPRRLFQPLKDVRLLGGTDRQGRTWPGVGVRAGAGEPYEETLDRLRLGDAEGRTFGDDWALVLYVMHLTRSADEVARKVRAWPRTELRKAD